MFEKSPSAPPRKNPSDAHVRDVRICFLEPTFSLFSKVSVLHWTNFSNKILSHVRAPGIIPDRTVATFPNVAITIFSVAKMPFSHTLMLYVDISLL